LAGAAASVQDGGMSGWVRGRAVVQRSVWFALSAVLTLPAWAEVPGSGSGAGAVVSRHVRVEARVTSLAEHPPLPPSLDPAMALGGPLPALATLGDPHPSSRSYVPNVGSNELGFALVVLGVVAGVGSIVAVIVAATD
jgi:hypothetical protein